MTEKMGQNGTKKLSSDPFSHLTETQWRYVTAMLEHPSYNKKQVAEYLGLSPKTIYNWETSVDDAVEAARQDIHDAALAMRKQAVLKAIAVKVGLLDSDDEQVRSKAATEIIEWELGKATQNTEFSGSLEIHDKTEARERLAHLINSRTARTGQDSDTEYTH